MAPVDNGTSNRLRLDWKFNVVIAIVTIIFLFFLYMEFGRIKIDGTSPATFGKSELEMRDALRSYQRVPFNRAMVKIIGYSEKECGPRPTLKDIPEGGSEQDRIAKWEMLDKSWRSAVNSKIRENLNGKTADEIIEWSEALPQFN